MKHAKMLEPVSFQEPYVGLLFGKVVMMPNTFEVLVFHVSSVCSFDLITCIPSIDKLADRVEPALNYFVSILVKEQALAHHEISIK